MSQNINGIRLRNKLTELPMQAIKPIKINSNILVFLKKIKVANFIILTSFIHIETVKSKVILQ